MIMGKTPLPKKTLSKKVSGMMTFPDALKAVISGKKVTKLEWERVNEYLVLKDGFLMIHHHADKDDVFHRLMVSEGDLVGKDWMIIND
jgi:hypothetical protein